MNDEAKFNQFELDERILSALERLNFASPTPIQAKTLPSLLAGKDVIGSARTGSGKTAAFGLPLLQRSIDRQEGPSAIVLCPTRELALQVTEAMRKYARNLKQARIVSIYGGAPYPPQIKALKNGATIVVGTPGRVLDHMAKKTLRLDHIQSVVLDEADEMLRMGFIDDVRAVLDAAPPERQVVLFSATMPPAIAKVAQDYLRDPVKIEAERERMTVDHIRQFGIVVPQRQKIDALRRVLEGIVTGPTLVFARTRLGCAETADELAKRGIAVDALHGNLTQAARERVLGRFRAQGLDLVIATDVAARGLDVDHITHVINFDLPDDVHTYVHRIGRTGRAGRQGTAISFITHRERRKFRFMHNTLNATIDVLHVPSDREIMRHRQKRLGQSIQTSVESPNEKAMGYLQRLQSEHGWSADQVASAALSLLAAARNAPLEELPAAPPPRASKPAFANKGKKQGAKRGPRSGPKAANRRGLRGNSSDDRRSRGGRDEHDGQGPRRRNATAGDKKFGDRPPSKARGAFRKRRGEDEKPSSFRKRFAEPRSGRSKNANANRSDRSASGERPTPKPSTLPAKPSGEVGSKKTNVTGPSQAAAKTKAAGKSLPTRPANASTSAAKPPRKPTPAPAPAAVQEKPKKKKKGKEREPQSDEKKKRSKDKDKKRAKSKDRKNKSGSKPKAGAKKRSGKKRPPPKEGKRRKP